MPATGSSPSGATVCIGPGGEHLGRAVLAATGLGHLPVSCRQFADGEVCMSVDAALPATVVIVQGTFPSQHRRLHELYQLVEIAAALGAARIVCVVPYLAYARQDRRTSPGEPASLEIVLRTLAMLGATELVTVDVHNPASLAEGPLSARSLSPAPVLANWVKGLTVSRPIIVSPDEGGRDRAEAVGALVGVETLVMSKRRDEEGRLTFAGDRDACRARDVVIVDDVCSSGSTLGSLVRWLGPAPATVSVAVTHLLAPAEMVQAAVAMPVFAVCGTDTVPGPEPRPTVATVVARGLAELGIG